MPVLAQLLPAVGCLSMMADYTSAGFLDSSTDAAPGGWAPKDGAGVVRFSALGLFPEHGTLVPTIAKVSKHAANPLFEQDRPWEPRLDNGYPNVVFSSESAQKGDGPWRLWYGGIGTGGQYLYYANSTDGLKWEKPVLNRYDLGKRWPKLKDIGKKNNIVMYGGGLGIFFDEHETNPALRYKISGGSPAGCYSDDGNEDCLVGTAGSPDGINDWSDAKSLGWPKPWRPDCHTNLFYDDVTSRYLMTTRSYISPAGRLISIAPSGGAGFAKTGTWTLNMTDAYPQTSGIHGCNDGDPKNAAAACGHKCMGVDGCRFFWTYTKGKKAGTCCLKSAVLPGPVGKPAVPDGGGEFYSMDGHAAPSNQSNFDWPTPPTIVERGVDAHQLYSQITWRFYDIYLGIVMVFDATNGNKGPHAGHVHCMLSWSSSATSGWRWVDQGGLEALKEFIPAGKLGSFESHVCFAAHTPLKMQDGSTRLFYMGGNGPHSGARNSSFALATTPPDRFAGLAGPHSGSSPAALRQHSGSATSRSVLVSHATMIMTLDVADGGSVEVCVSPGSLCSSKLTQTGTDVEVAFPAHQEWLQLVGKSVTLKVTATKATVFTLGFK